MKTIIIPLVLALLLLQISINEAFGQTAFDKDQTGRSGEILLQESFDVLGVFPEDWFIQYNVTGNPGAGLDNWSISNTLNAGGVAPELRFHFSPTFSSGYSRMVTKPVFVGGYTELELIFKHRLSNFTTNANEQIAVELSSDGGDTWQVLWFFNIFSSLGPEEKTLNIQYSGANDTIHIGFRFSGNSYNIFNWSIDDVLLRSTPQEDLIAGNFTGPVLLSANQEYNWELEVFNNGQSAQSGYQIKLMKTAAGGDIELASTPGVAVAPGQTAIAAINWIPDPAFTGLHHVYAYIDFDEDQDLTNNASETMVIRVLEEWAIAKTVGSGKEYANLTSFRIPFDFYYKNNLHQVIYYPEELDHFVGPIHGLVYFSNFTSDDVEDEEVKLWIGMTTTENFMESNGFIPVTGQTLVFHEEISVPKSESLIYIEFDEPFLYTGNNLIITSNRVFYAGNANYDATDRYYSSDSPYNNRSMRAQSNTTVYYPQLPPPGIFGGSMSSWHPNTSFVFSSSGIGSMQGIITDSGGNPLEGVLVSTVEYAISATSNQNGFYSLPNVPVGEVNLLATLFGYEDAAANTIIIEGQTSTVDITMTLLQTITVSGKVTGSDFPAVGIEDALIKLEGYGNFETTSNADGEFLIEGVFSEKMYDVTISKSGFENYTTTIETGAVNIDLGTIILNEIPTPPEGVRAIEVTSTQSEVYWYAPGAAPFIEFRYDDGFAIGGLGYETGSLNSVLGPVYRNEALIESVKWYHHNASTIYPWVTIRFFGLDEDGYPLNTSVIKRFDSIPYQNQGWNLFTLPEPLYISDGFMIGISALGFLGIGHDDGIEHPYTFKPNTMYVSANTFNTGFTPLENQGYEANLMVRAFGIDYGPLIYNDKSAGVMPSQPPSLLLNPMDNLPKTLDGYRVYRLPDGDQGNPQNWIEIANFTADTTVTDVGWGTLPVATYRYAVKAIYTNENLSEAIFSNKLFRDETTSAGEIPIPGKSILIYPNPASDQLNISVGIPILKAVLYDFNGKQILHLTPSTNYFSIDLKNLPNGIYYLKLVSDREVFMEKVVVRK